MLILASTGDMALAGIIADRTGVDMDRVRAEMEHAPGHWAAVATSSALLTCPKCGQPGWPDCDCTFSECSEEEAHLVMPNQTAPYNTVLL